MSSTTFTRSFAGGEVAPLLYGRLDLAKFQTGLRKCQNFIVTPQGPIMNRPGFEYVLQAKGKCVLIPFVYNAEQSFALEVGTGYIRFHTQGATLLEAGVPITSITNANPGVFTRAAHGFSNDQWVYLSGMGAMTDLQARFAIIANATANTYQLKDLYGNLISTALMAAYAGGGTAARVYEISNPYAEADLFDLHYVQSADVLTIVHQDYQIRELRRLGATNWTLTTPSFVPTIGTPGTPTTTVGGPGGGTAKEHTYVVTAVAAETLEESLASASTTVSRDLTVTGNYIDVQPPVVAGAVRYNVYRRESGIYGYIGQTDGSAFRDDSISPDLSKTPPLSANPFGVGAINSVTVTNGGAGYGSVPQTGGVIDTVTVTAGGAGYTTASATASGGGSGATFTVNLVGNAVSSITINNGGSLYSSPTITITGDGAGATATATATPIVDHDVTLGVTGPPGSGASLEPVVVGGVITGVRIAAGGSGYVAPAVSVTDAAGGAGAAFTATLTANDVNPQAVSYFEQRRCFGGSTLYPQKVWTTRSATESNMTYSIPTQDDDAITARIVSRQANVVRHLVPTTDLLAFTSSGVWQLSPGTNDVLTPATIAPKQHSSVGASMVPPIDTSESILYVPDRGCHIREIAYKWEQQKYTPEDVSVLAPHLFDYHGVLQLAYSSIPLQILWAVRDDGVLLGLTHQPEHEVRAWHQHTTQGTFEAVCSIPEGDEDGVYVSVTRQIGTNTLRYIERMHSRHFAALEDAFFVDAGATYSGAAVTTVTGLWHLEGAEVVALADGGVEPPQTVGNGRIALGAAASKVHVGLSYTADAETLPLSLEVAGFGQGVPKNVSEVALRTYQSSGIKVGPSFDKLTEYAQRTSDDEYGTPPSMYTGIATVKPGPSWQQDGTVCIRQSDPVPLTVLAMTVKAGTGG